MLLVSTYKGISQALPNQGHSFLINLIVKKNKNLIIIPGKQSFMLVNSQSINASTTKWLLQSNNTMADFQDHVTKVA